MARPPADAAHRDPLPGKSRSQNLTAHNPKPSPASPPPGVHTLPFAGRILLAAGANLHKAWLATLRIRVQLSDSVREDNRNGPGIFLYWHNRIFAAPLTYRLFPDRPGCVLTSASRDGAYLSAAVARFGLHSVRGSSSRHGSRAVRELLERLQMGWNVAITPDGPRGPRYVMSPGAILLAQQSGCPIHPVHLHYPNAWRLQSWDRFFLPRPFSRVFVEFGEALRIERTQTPEAFESERLRVQAALCSGLPPEELAP